MNATLEAAEKQGAKMQKGDKRFWKIKHAGREVEFLVDVLDERTIFVDRPEYLVRPAGGTGEIWVTTKNLRPIGEKKEG